VRVATTARDREVRANPFDRQWAAIREDALAAVARVGESGWYVLGREVEAFERDLAAFSRVHCAVGCASGLDAIEIGLRALGLAPGEEVLTTPLSAFATTLAIVRAGGVPVFVDTDAGGLVDLERAAECCAARPGLRFFVPVHLFGHALDLEHLGRLRREHDLAIVEDAAQAVGASSRGAQVGSVGQVTALSFYPTKNLGALGDGGALLTDDDDLAAAARCLRDYGQSAKYEHDRLGLNSRLDELHAAVLSSALLPRLSEWTARRGHLAALYLDGLDHPLVHPLPAAEGSESVWHLFPVVVDEARRDEMLRHLRAAGVQAGIHYPGLIPDQSALADVAGGFHVLDRLANARRLAASEVSLPIHPFLRDDEVERAIEVVNGWEPA
jgi:dTDP-3-amino-3,4,6-trideoxy-alpha-D-glucose transaminase